MPEQFKQLTFVVSLYILFSVSACTQTRSHPVTAKFAPMHNKVLVFVGQDNASVGGNGQWTQGYVDTVGVPASITHYVYFSEGKQNRFGGQFDIGSVDGLNQETSWAAGPMCMRCYVESETLKNSVIHLSISMEHDDETAVAAGEYDHNITELIAFLKEFSDYPFIIRIGYEFDGDWNSYEPEAFKRAWQRIVDQLRLAKLTNFATLMASYDMSATRETWENYWPGDTYVDWIGYSYWAKGDAGSSDTLALAREKNLPVFIAETTPRGSLLDQVDGQALWDSWFKEFFQHVEQNQDVIKAISYINAHWDAQIMWDGGGWGNSQLQDNEIILHKWLEKKRHDLYVHGTDNTYQLINFTSAPGPD